VTDADLDRVSSPRAILERVSAAEREVQAILEEAAQLAPDADERVLYAQLAQREEQSLRALERERDRLDAVEFVQQALDV
jgi:hypothetical protein